MKHEHHTATKVVNPVCGMTIAPEDSVGLVEREGKTYHFCSSSCEEKFQADPLRYTAEASEATSPPQLHHDPVCGMDIESKDATGTLEHDGKLYYFCGNSCVEKFKADPKRYLEAPQLQKAPNGSESIE